MVAIHWDFAKAGREWERESKLMGSNIFHSLLIAESTLISIPSQLENALQCEMCAKDLGQQRKILLHMLNYRIYCPLILLECVWVCACARALIQFRAEPYSLFMCAFASLLHVVRNFVKRNANNAPFSGETRLGSEIIIALMNENSIFNILAKKFIIPFEGERARLAQKYHSQGSVLFHVFCVHTNAAMCGNVFILFGWQNISMRKQSWCGRTESNTVFPPQMCALDTRAYVVVAEFHNNVQLKSKLSAPNFSHFCGRCSESSFN